MTTTTEILNQPEAQLSVERTIALLEAPEFQQGFVDVQTSSEREAVDSIIADARTAASGTARGEIEEFTAAQLGTTVEEGKRLGKEWGLALKAAGATTSETTAGKTLQEHLFDTHLAEIETTPDFQQSSSLAREALAQATITASEQATSLIQEIHTRKNDPAFVEAASVWSNSPNSSGEIGEDGQGYNAGLVHFFEYRGDTNKRKNRLQLMALLLLAVNSKNSLKLLVLTQITKMRY
jgi:hypothetical protein